MLQSLDVGGLVAQPVHQPVIHPTALAVTTGSSSHEVPKFNRRKAIGMGTTLIVAAVLGIIMNFIDITYPHKHWSLGYLGHGFWSGLVVSILLIVTNIRLIDRAATN
jgi:hypothetical protein